MNITIRIKDMRFSLKSWERDSLTNAISKKLGIPAGTISQIKIIKRAVDARKKNDILLVFTLEAVVEQNYWQKLKDKPFIELVDKKQRAKEPIVTGNEPLTHPPVVIGAGPAGLFAALILAIYGYKPILVERGAQVEERTDH
ncbi:MAG: FAD-dependent monooxygenase, partial [Bacillota bacterium]|nr:FAD-dependent monooxygenase [Bacillota bacterium]